MYMWYKVQQMRGLCRLSFRNIVKGGHKLNVENFGGVMYRVGKIFWGNQIPKEGETLTRGMKAPPP